MNKTAAKKLVEEGNLTIGELRKAIKDRRGGSGMSAVNPAFTIDQVLDIYERAFEGREDGEKIEPFTYSPSRDRNVKTGDALAAQNIVRDCM